MNGTQISLVDTIIIGVYLIGILVVGILSVKQKRMSSDQYFLAGRGLNWALVGAALFASNISTIHTVILIAGALILTTIAVFALSDHGIHTLADFKANLKPGQFSVLHSKESIKVLSPTG